MIDPIHPTELGPTSDELCSASLAEAREHLTRGCAGLLDSTGLDLSPDYLAHALRVPHLAAEVSNRIDSACRALGDPVRMANARDSLESIIASTKSLRAALGRAAKIQGASAKAISSYADNL